ncbi:hypothetical protein DY000_02032868 [Brassica cretica]|uniref:Uncharacterized protein n=1 Tax=Brassica cretica TaxID=69181 RepID=A0ABQ7DUG9_BRACR|nr:hypothetical protein DY000_02032868 [Brassica cretica]
MCPKEPQHKSTSSPGVMVEFLFTFSQTQTCYGSDQGRVNLLPPGEVEPGRLTAWIMDRG